jgi:hypothetical protein
MQPNLKSHIAHTFFCIPLFLIFFVSSIETSGQCIAINNLTGITAANEGQTGITFNQATAGNLDTQGDENKAVASVTLNPLGSAQTKYLKLTGFNFAVPSYATICGIKVTIVKRATKSIIGLLTTKVTDREVRLVKNGAISNGDNKALGEWSNNTYESITYGREDNVWGETLTPADVNGLDFGVAISANFEAGLLGLAGQVLLTAEIDKISMTVYYSLPVVLPLTLYSFDAKLSNKTVLLNWGLAEQEEHAVVTVQRSLNNKGWQDIYQHSLKNSTTLQYYQFKDNPIESGDYSYRLKLTAATGKVTFSPVRIIRFKNASSLIVYPIPAQTRLSVSSNGKIKEISVTNLFQQKIEVPMSRLNDQSLELNLERLPSGVYFVHTQESVKRFIKQ